LIVKKNTFKKLQPIEKLGKNNTEQIALKIGREIVKERERGMKEIFEIGKNNVKEFVNKMKKFAIFVMADSQENVLIVMDLETLALQLIIIAVVFVMDMDTKTATV